MTAGPARGEDDPDQPGGALAALQPEVLGLEAGEKSLLGVSDLDLPHPQAVVLGPEHGQVWLGDGREDHHGVDVLLPDQPPEVNRRVLLGVLRQDELGQAVEAGHPAGVDVVGALHVLDGRELDPGAVLGEEVKALVLQLVARHGGSSELSLPGFVAGDLVEMSLQQLPGRLLRRVVALQALDVAAQVGRQDVRLPASDGLGWGISHLSLRNQKQMSC